MLRGERNRVVDRGDPRRKVRGGDSVHRGRVGGFEVVRNERNVTARGEVLRVAAKVCRTQGHACAAVEEQYSRRFLRAGSCEDLAADILASARKSPLGLADLREGS